MSLLLLLLSAFGLGFCTKSLVECFKTQFKKYFVNIDDLEEYVCFNLINKQSLLFIGLIVVLLGLYYLITFSSFVVNRV